MTSTLAYDVEILDSGTICFVTPLSQAGSDWTAANLCVEDWQLSGEGSIAVEPRLVGEIIFGMIEDGLEVRVR